jgi:hypothetical protein
MACERYKTRIVDEAQAPGGDAELTSHLTACPECRTELARQQELQNRISGSLAAMVAGEPSPALLARVRRRADAIDAIHVEEFAQRAGWLQWALGGVALAALAGLAFLFAGRALFRQSAPGPQPGQTVGGTPTAQTSAQAQPATGSGAANTVPSTAPAVVARNLVPRPSPSAQLAATHHEAHVEPSPAIVPAGGAPGFKVIVPPGQREAVLRLVAAMKSGRVNVAGLLDSSEQQQMTPLEITPIKITPLEEKKTAGQSDGKQK